MVLLTFYLFFCILTNKHTKFSKSKNAIMVIGIKFQMNQSLYIRDPQTTKLGQKILQYSILMMAEMGFESFNFKKLSLEIDCAEKSIYRYFDNKHMLLLFLTSWYWEWVNYLITINIKNISYPNTRLEVAIKCIVKATSENAANEFINERALHKVVINEGSKSYHTYTVDEENKVGLFLSYKSLVACLKNLICDVNPEFPYAASLASNLLEMANNQIYFAEHLPSITDIHNTETKEEELIGMLNYFASRLLA